MNQITEKILIVMLLLTVSMSNSWGQGEKEIKIPLSNPSEPGKLKLHLLNGSIRVMGYSGNEVIIKATSGEGDHRHKDQERNGLKKITSNNVSFTAEEFENKVRIKSSDWNSAADFEIKVPKNFSLDLKATNDGDIVVENVNGEFEISNLNGAITMTGISGSVIADALNEDVKVQFVKVTPGEYMAFSSLNGDLNIVFPASLKADINAKTDNGNLYTDFDIKLKPNTDQVSTEKVNGVYKVTYENKIKGTINGGGAEIKFKAFNGDILIKKNK